MAVTKKRGAKAVAPVVAEGYSWPELHRLVGTTLRAGLSVLLRGHPGVGKSTLAQALAVDLGLPLIDIRLAQRDPSDLAGVWFPDKEQQQLVAYPPAWAKMAADQPCLVFLDEINAAVTKLHQAAAYQIVLEKRVGEVRFHPETVVLAAGNLEEDNAIVTSLSSALCNRFAHFIMRIDDEAWVEWGTAVGLEPSILAYVRHHGAEVLYDQSHPDLAFPSPRSWEMASRVLQAGDARDARRLVTACVGSVAAEAFFAWRQVFAKVDVERIVHRGDIPDFTAPKYADPSFVHATTFAVAGYLRASPPLPDAAVDHVVRFLTAPGLDPEYVLLLLRHLRSNDALFAQLRQHAAFRAMAARLVDVRASLYQ
jgi:MoxR-like ATPase